jgi:hypothetical protein
MGIVVKIHVPIQAVPCSMSCGLYCTVRAVLAECYVGHCEMLSKLYVAACHVGSTLQLGLHVAACHVQYAVPYS